MSAGDGGAVVAGRRFGVELRAAQAADGVELGRLMAQLDIRLEAADAAARLEAFRGRGAVLVATGYEGLSGMAAACWSPSMEQPHLVAQLSTLVVDADERRRGIGRLLLKGVSQAARAAGCGIIESAAAAERPEWAAFCRATGFTSHGEAFARSLRRRSDAPA